MRFMFIVRSAQENFGPPPPALMEAMAKSAEEQIKAGAMLDTGGLVPPAQGARIRSAHGEVIVTDGPYAEAKELIGGYAVFELKSMKEAIESGVAFMNLHKEHWPEWEGECEVRQIIGTPEELACAQPAGARLLA